MVTVDYNMKIRDIEPLVEGQWAAWSHEMKFSFLEAGITHYLDGSNAPEESEKKSIQTKWKIINSCFIEINAQSLCESMSNQLGLLTIFPAASCFKW